MVDTNTQATSKNTSAQSLSKDDGSLLSAPTMPTLVANVASSDQAAKSNSLNSASLPKPKLPSTFSDKLRSVFQSARQHRMANNPSPNNGANNSVNNSGVIANDDLSKSFNKPTSFITTTSQVISQTTSRGVGQSSQLSAVADKSNFSFSSTKPANSINSYTTPPLSSSLPHKSSTQSLPATNSQISPKSTTLFNQSSPSSAPSGQPPSSISFNQSNQSASVLPTSPSSKPLQQPTMLPTQQSIKPMSMSVSGQPSSVPLVSGKQLPPPPPLVTVKQPLSSPSKFSSSVPPLPPLPPQPPPPSSPTPSVAPPPISRPAVNSNPVIVKPANFFLKWVLAGVVIIAILVLALIGWRFAQSGSNSSGSSASLSVQPESTNVSKTDDTNGVEKTNKTNTTNNKTTANQNQPVTKQVRLVYWGLWEPMQVMRELIDEYQQKNPNVVIDYRQQSHIDYRERLQTAIESGNGPDLFRFHATWVPMLKQNLDILPVKIISTADFSNLFYPVAKDQLQVNGQIVGIPLMYDGLVLFYNKEFLRTAQAQVPKNWVELRQLANKLTVPGDKSARTQKIERGGLAIGNTKNVDHFADILALLILQNEGDPLMPNTTQVSDALSFYTNFVKDDFVWNAKLPSSTIAFARGEVAMMFAPSWRAHEIKSLNPNLDFAMAPVPQISDKKIAFASYWAEGVNAKSANKEQAWKFLQFLSSKEAMLKFYQAGSAIRLFGEPPSRQDLANQFSSTSLLYGLIADAPYAKWAPMASFTHDNGINDEMIGYYQQAIEAIFQGKNIKEILGTLSAGVQTVMRKYSR